jgi:hypothetical protein
VSCARGFRIGFVPLTETCAAYGPAVTSAVDARPGPRFTAPRPP